MPHFKDLPPYYYHDHFVEMLDFVVQIYGAMLDEAHLAFINTFQALTKSQQCLYVRMANRKGLVFCQQTLVYPEIDDIDNAINGLLDSGLASLAEESHYSALLHSFTKTDLLDLACQAGHSQFKRSWTKSRLAIQLQKHLSFEAFALLNAGRHLVQTGHEQLEFLLYLYFGKTQEDLKNFTLRDLGIIPVNSGSSFKARFEDASEAKAAFGFSQLLLKMNSPKEKVCFDILESLKVLERHPSHYVQRLKDKLCLKLGRFFENRQDIETAISAYHFAESFDCQERLIRLMHKHVSVDDAQQLLEKMIDDPVSDEAYVFATDFYARKYKRQKLGACTELLRSSSSIMVDELHRNAPESAATLYFARQGWDAYHTENGLWASLFGLLFWDELFEHENSLHSSFDWIPQSLKKKTFHQLFSSEIQIKLDAVRNGKAIQLILKAISAHWEKPNGIFTWDEILTELMTDFLKTAKPQAVTQILELMTKNYQEFRDGFPDLTLIANEKVRFVEIKTEGDQLKRNQLTRLRQLQRAGFDAEICRVNYTVDPDQPYVVIDIETTGGNPGDGRITEIGAVKVQNHEIIGEWQSLINPQRRIPSFIVQLTGITDEMVQHAPSFSEIADELKEFIGDAVFVAHNVNFDYGFIAYEYGQLGEMFRYPKLCTRAEMRRHFPGLKSYSLANLCETYNIPLIDHHRALSDAKATTHLLSLINRKREKALVDSIAIAQ